MKYKTELECYEAVNATKSLEELADVIRNLADDKGLVKGRNQEFKAESMAKRCARYNEIRHKNVLTRMYGIRQQAMMHEYNNDVTTKNTAKLVILFTQSGDWSGLYASGSLIDEGHVLGEGDPFSYWIKMSNKFDFNIADLRNTELIDVDDDLVSETGSFPKSISDLKGNYYGEE